MSDPIPAVPGQSIVSYNIGQGVLAPIVAACLAAQAAAEAVGLTQKTYQASIASLADGATGPLLFPDGEAYIDLAEGVPGNPVRVEVAIHAEDAATGADFSSFVAQFLGYLNAAGELVFADGALTVTHPTTLIGIREDPVAAGVFELTASVTASSRRLAIQVFADSTPANAAARVSALVTITHCEA